MAFIDRYEPDETKDLMGQMKRFGRVLVYMPTWRDSQNDFIASGFDFKALETVLAESDSLFLVKPHANTTIDAAALEGLSHVKLLPATLDVYPLLPFTDVLVTDYSSIMYDYILMEAKDVILYLFDYREYISERPFIWSFDEMSYGHRAYDFDSLLNLIRNAELRPDEDAKTLLAEKCWEENRKDACERIASFFQQA